MKASTTLRNNMLKDKGFKEIMETTGMCLVIYSGDVPATADAVALTANKLCVITESDGGIPATASDSLLFDADPVAGVLAKEPTAHVWSGTVDTTGTATFFRLIGGYATETAALAAMNAGDAANVIQGTVGVSGADLNLVSTSLVATTTQTIEYFVVSFPTD